MPEAPAVVAPAPTTLKGQLEEFFKALGVADFNTAIARVNDFNEGAQIFGANQKAFFDILGAADQDAAMKAITQIKSDRDALFKALGNSPDIESAIGVLGNMQNDRNALWKAIGATDHNSAIAAIGTLNTRVTTAEDAQKNFETRLETGIQEGVIARGASAGMPTPVPKIVTGAKAAGEAITPRRRLGQLFSEQIGEGA